MSESPSKTAPPTKIAVLISGTGTNLGKLIEATQSGILAPHRIIRVIGNCKGAEVGLKLAKDAGIPTRNFNIIAEKYRRAGEKDQSVLEDARRRYDADLAKMVLEDEPDLIVCAGWMAILTPSFLDPLANANVPIINLHPALPGEFDGAEAITRAWSAFKDGTLISGKTGAMVHYVIREVDRGTPIVVREVPCVEGKIKSEEDLRLKIRKVEHEIIVEGTALAISNLWEQRRAAAKE